jgi:hypothetical protein
MASAEHGASQTESGQVDAEDILADVDRLRSDGTIEDLNTQPMDISVFTNLAHSTSLEKLLKFAARLEESRSLSSDPAWFVVNEFGSRSGAGSKDLLLGVPVDPKCNPAHKHAVQYLADTGLLIGLSSPPFEDDSKQRQSLMVTSVSFMDTSIAQLNKGVTSFSKVRRLALISLQESTSVSIAGVEQLLARVGDVVTFGMHEMMSLNFVAGSGILVAFGSLIAHVAARNRLTHSGVRGAVELQSIEFSSIKTTNRVGRTAGVFQSLIPCPDCRRAIEIRRYIERETDAVSATETLVTVICDENELVAAIETGNNIKARYADRVALVTDEKFITEDLKEIWPVQHVVSPLNKWTKKRGLHDYCVPEGFVTPVLFPKTLEHVIKDTMYTTIRAVGVEQLWGKRVWLIDPDAHHGVELIPSKAMYTQMLAELRDWNHPGHQARESAVTFITEWTQIYE